MDLSLPVDRVWSETSLKKLSSLKNSDKVSFEIKIMESFGLVRSMEFHSCFHNPYLVGMPTGLELGKLQYLAF